MYFHDYSSQLINVILFQLDFTVLLILSIFVWKLLEVSKNNASVARKSFFLWYKNGIIYLKTPLIIITVYQEIINNVKLLY